MKRLRQYFRNIKMSAKLLISYFLIASVAIGAIGAVMYSSANRQYRANSEQAFRNAAHLSVQLLEERCARATRSITYLATDTNTQQIVNRTDYISEYQKAYDVVQILEPTIINVMEQNELIDEVLFYTNGEIKGSRHYFMDIEEAEDAQAVWQSDAALWKRDGDWIALSCVLPNVWNPADSAIVTMRLERELLFGGLLPDVGMDSRITITDSEGNMLLESTSVTDDSLWEREKDHCVEMSQVLKENGWQVHIMGILPAGAGVDSAVARNIIFILICVAVLMLLAAWLFSSGISSRVATLRQQVEQVVESNYQCDISSEDRDEIGVITNVVGQMVCQTRQVILQKYQSELNYRDAKLQALQAQINPHFLYNTLSNLNWRAIAKEDMETSELLTNLSRFYRLSLNGGRIESTLEQELQHIRLYIQLFKAIHSETEFEVQWNLDSGILTSPMPCMILQPLVENAFEHGLPEGGLKDFVLGITVQTQDEDIVLKVSDNGNGISPEKEIEKILESESEAIGFGLRNVYNRLRLYFEDSCSMTFEQTQGGGTTVVIRFPQN